MPHDRTDRRAEEALNRPENRVALFLDYENIRHSLEHHFDPPPGTTDDEPDSLSGPRRQDR